MAFSNGLKSPNEASFPSYPSPMRPIGSQMPSTASTTPAERAGLHRRFTTNALPTLPTLSSMSPLSPIGQQRRQAAEPSGDLASAAVQKVQLLTSVKLQKRKEEFEHLREQRKRFQTELELMDLRAKASEHELQRLEHDLHRISLPGYQSEPTTPPEYRDNGFPSALSRPNRLSMASLTSAQGVGSIASPRTNRSGSQSYTVAYNNMSQNSSQLPSSSMPGSRRGSDEEEDNYQYEIANIHRRTGPKVNRNSMPVTNFDLRNMMPDVNSVLGINNINALLGEDDEEDDTVGGHPLTGTNGILHMETTSEGFPILGRRQGEHMQPTPPASALDLNMSAAGDEAQTNGWPSSFAGASRHRVGQSMSAINMNSFRGPQAEEQDLGHTNAFATPPKKANRHSMDVHSFANFGESKRSSLHAATNGLANGMPKLQQSYSTNDIPTMKNTQGLSEAPSSAAANLTHAEQHLQNHNANLGRIPMNAGSRLSRDLSAGEGRAEEKAIRPMSSVLQPAAAPFGPTATSSTGASVVTSASASSTISASTFTSPTMPSNSIGATYGGVPPYYPPYGGMVNGASNGFQNGMNSMAMLNMGMSGMSMGSPPPQWNNQTPVYQQPYGAYGGYQNPYGNNRAGQRDSQAQVMAQRRNQGSDDNARYANYKIEAMQGQLYELCKDQHGCRFLQRKLEERDPAHIQMIFEETKDHVVELMIDPFGNYLCQKLLEFSTDEQRTQLIRNAAPEMVRIALNQHGTRALQKMIEFISAEEQITIVKGAFEKDVVCLIQDLNGNHVIQKCLNHLKPDQAQFIFHEVALNCLIVGTHRHGCCVLQRCIDHATGAQKAKLVHAVIDNAYSLVQDPFGNYVVQYILDLSNPDFTRPLCLGFRGRMCELSKQKFSSNVMEKCVRVSDSTTSQSLVEEFMASATEMEKLLRDHYANYVVQTALEHSDEETKNRLWDLIIPIIPNIRSTPCGRRLVQKLQIREAEAGNSITNGQYTPNSTTPPATTPQRQLANHTYHSPAASVSYSAASTNGYGSPYSSQIASPQPHRLSNATVPTHLQNSVNQQYNLFNRVQGNGQAFASTGQQGYVSQQSFNSSGQQSYASPPQQNFATAPHAFTLDGAADGSVNGGNSMGSFF